MILLYVTHRMYGEGPREWTNLIIMGFVANLKTTPWAESWSKFLKFWFTGGRWRCEETKINNRNLRHWKGGTDRSIVSVPMDVVFRHLFTVDDQLLNRIGQWLLWEEGKKLPYCLLQNLGPVLLSKVSFSRRKKMKMD